MSNVRFSRPGGSPPIVKNLIIINVIVFIAQIVLASQFDLTEKFALHPIIPGELKAILTQYYRDFNLTEFSPYQVFTHMFTHAPFPTIFHILFNMLVLWVFGRVLESVWGSKRFLTFYLICGVGAAVFHLLIQYIRAEMMLHAINGGLDIDVAVAKYGGALVSAVGASGAIMGVMAAFAYLFPNTPLYLMFIPVPIKAKWAILIYIMYDLFFGVTGGDNVAHFAHLGGAITGFILVLIWNKTNRKTLY
jgi:rhomboid family protein